MVYALGKSSKNMGKFTNEDTKNLREPLEFNLKLTRFA
jgi:hypothetical protein